MVHRKIGCFRPCLGQQKSTDSAEPSGWVDGESQSFINLEAKQECILPYTTITKVGSLEWHSSQVRLLGLIRQLQIDSASHIGLDALLLKQTKINTN